MGNGDTDWTSIPSTPPEVVGDDSPNMQLASIIKTVRSSEENEALEIWTDTEEEWLKRLQEYYGFNLEDFEEFDCMLVRQIRLKFFRFSFCPRSESLYQIFVFTLFWLNHSNHISFHIHRDKGIIL